jgi:hypothetical protein
MLVEASALIDAGQHDAAEEKLNAAKALLADAKEDAQ